MVNFKVIFLKVRSRIISLISKKIITDSDYSKNHTFKLTDGSLFNYPLNSSIGYSLANGGFEISEVEFVRNSLRQGDTVLDIGANGGFYTIIAAKIVGNKGHVYACEPGSRELELLRQNININKLTNVTIIESAIGNKEGMTKFAIAKDGALNSLLENDHPSQQIECWQTVEMNTVDNLVKKLNIEKVNFIKLDVEGAEKIVLEGAEKLLKSSKNITIMFEASELTSSKFGYNSLELINLFLEAGFRIKYFGRFGKTIDISPDDKRIGNKIHNFIAYK